MKKNCVYLLFLCVSACLAQPGGGGGLMIEGIYNKKLDKIDLLNDHSLKLRAFMLSSPTGIYETFAYERHKLNGRKNGLFLAPMSPNEIGYFRNTDQRIVIEHGGQLMVIDLLNIIGGNGAGIHLVMDSLIVREGYFSFDLRGTRTYNSTDDPVRKLVNNGLTLYTLELLSRAGYVRRESLPDMSFLQEKNLQPVFFVERARFQLQLGHPQAAINDLEKSIERNGGIETCDASLLLCQAYSMTTRYEKAVEYISKALHCKENVSMEEWRNIQSNYETRIELYIHLKQYGKALADYDTICSFSKDITWPPIQRAEFKIKYLRDYGGAIKDMKHCLDPGFVRPPGSNYYSTNHSPFYFTLGIAEYFAGNHKIAYQHWLRSAEQNFSPYALVLHFDSMIVRHPRVAELYLARGLSHANQAPYEGWGKLSRQRFLNALNDFDRATELGMKRELIEPHRKEALDNLKKTSSI